MLASVKTRIFNTLRWSERYTKTDMVYLVSGGFWLGGGHVLSIFVGFFTTVALGYFLPKTGYGDYRYVLSVFAVLSAFTLTGLNTAIIQAVARGFDGSLKQGFRLSIKWSGLAVAGALAGSAYYLWRDNTFLSAALLMIALAMPFFHSFGLFASYINGKKDFKRLSIYNAINNVVPSIVLIGAVYSTDNILLIVFMYFFSHTLLGYWLYKRTVRVYTPLETIDPDLASYSIKLSFLNVVGIITAHIDKVIVYTTLGAVELAVYGFATAFPDQIRNLLKNLSTMMVPKFTEQEARGGVIQLSRKVKQLSLLLLVVTGIYIIIAPHLYALFFPKYPESVLYSQILSLSIFSALAMIPSSLFIAQKREKEMAQSMTVGSVMQIIILIPAVYWGGLMGVCIARVFASYVNLGVAYYFLKNRSPAHNTNIEF
jgi:O-antigen/teichoic acid export membrane protein